MSKRKPFSETKVGQFLKEKLPDVVDKIGESFPAANILKLIVGERLSPEDQLKLDELLLDYEKLELEDRKDARSREVEFVRALGHVDWSQIFVGAIVMASFVFLQYVLVYQNIPKENREIFLHLVGMIDTAAGLVIGYYFGSSKGSRDKDKLIGK
jgi:hypothetical protein